MILICQGINLELSALGSQTPIPSPKNLHNFIFIYSLNVTFQSPDSVGLKVSGNCCRPAHWDAKLGFQDDPRPLCLPIIHVAADGGLVGCLDVILTRIYPIRVRSLIPIHHFNLFKKILC